MEIIGKNTPFGWCQTWDDESDNSRNVFYSDHYSKVRKAKGKEAISESYFNSAQNGFIPEHELAPTLGKGKKIVLCDGKTVFVDSVYQHFDKGYYLYLMYYTFTDSGNRSHGGLFYKNISCHSPSILNFIDENKNNVFKDSSIDEKINIIVVNRKKLNLPTIIHINKKDADEYTGNYKIINIQKNIDTINDTIKKAKENNNVLILSGNITEIPSNKYEDLFFTQIDDIIDAEDIILFHRNYEK